jgi:mutual gliding-motility protein MglA
MALVNYSTREITTKIVYYGPGRSGKTSNLQYVHAFVPDNRRGPMVSLATETDRTLFFDFLPLDLGDISGFRTRMQLYTVPGQVYYNATRKLVLRGADGVVFVADSQRERFDDNVESLRNLHENLLGEEIVLRDFPMVLQYNKRDLPDVVPVDELDDVLNFRSLPAYTAAAVEGTGVFDTLKGISQLVLQSLSRRFREGGKQAQRG